MALEPLCPYCQRPLQKGRCDEHPMATLLTSHEPRARKTDPSTSHKAAKVAKVRAGTRMYRILGWVDALGGNVTIREVCEYGRSPTDRSVCISPLFKPMVDRGLLRLTGEERQWEGEGAKSAVHELTERGKEALRNV